MKRVTLVAAGVLMLCGTAHAKPIEFHWADGSVERCDRRNGRPIVVDDCWIVSDPVLTATPSPAPTPAPTRAPDCRDGTIGGGTLDSRTLVRRGFDVRGDRESHLCANLPPSVLDRPHFEIKTTNHGNASCADLIMTAIAPSGRVYETNGWQPGVPPRSEAGRWEIVLELDPIWTCRTFDLWVLW